MVTAGIESAVLWQRLRERGVPGSSSSVLRVVQRLVPRLPAATVRVAWAPSEEAHVDCGLAGPMMDPGTDQARRAWAFVMPWSWSRSQDVEGGVDQTVEPWLRLHVHAFDWFGGVPHRLVIDTLKAALRRAVPDDPPVQQSSRDCAGGVEGADSSAPSRLIGQARWVSGGLQPVRLFPPDSPVVASHERATRPVVDTLRDDPVLHRLPTVGR